MNAPRTHASIAIARLAKSRRAQAALAILGTLGLFAVFADLIAADAPLFGTSVGSLLPIGPNQASATLLAAPSSAHWLGTDELGRDVLARLVHGTRSALGASLLAMLASVVLGLVIGALAGSGSSRWNRRLDRLVETVDTFPAILVVAVLRASEPVPSVLSVALGVSLVKWAEIARIVRAEGLRLGTGRHVLAAQSLGASRRMVLRRHILPHLVGPVAVSVALGIASVTLLETAVSFLELGAPAREASWGELLAQAARNPEHWPLVIAPTLAIALTVGAAHLLSDALRDATSPRMSRH